MMAHPATSFQRKNSCLRKKPKPTKLWPNGREYFALIFLLYTILFFGLVTSTSNSGPTHQNNAPTYNRPTTVPEKKLKVKQYKPLQTERITHRSTLCTSKVHHSDHSLYILYTIYLYIIYILGIASKICPRLLAHDWKVSHLPTPKIFTLPSPSPKLFPHLHFYLRSHCHVLLVVMPWVNYCW